MGRYLAYDHGAVLANFDPIIGGRHIGQELDANTAVAYGEPYMICETATRKFAEWLAFTFDVPLRDTGNPDD